MSTTRLQEVLVCLRERQAGRHRHGAAVAALWRFSKLNAALANPKLATENDAEEYGKGHEFPTVTYKTAWDVGGTIEKYLGAEIAAWAVAFGLGKVVKSGGPNYVYTCTPLIPANGDCRGTAVLLLRGADPPGRGRGPRPPGGRHGHRVLPDHGGLWPWPRQQQDQHRVCRFRQGDRLRDRHHDARRDSGEAPAVRVARLCRSTAWITSPTRTSSRWKRAGRTTSGWIPASFRAPASRRLATGPRARSVAAWSSATA